ncbi:MAG: hypothetical protein FJY91_00875 [Candidatus Harrisonbacteria bacterium]|nr:hypothetical protein [Candidatus Harrisonbacteria bacterium]
MNVNKTILFRDSEDRHAGVVIVAGRDPFERSDSFQKICHIHAKGDRQYEKAFLLNPNDTAFAAQPFYVRKPDEEGKEVDFALAVLNERLSGKPATSGLAFGRSGKPDYPSLFRPLPTKYVIIVPQGYTFESFWMTFWEKYENHPKRYFYENLSTAQNFSQSVVLRPGQKIEVTVFEQTVDRLMTSSVERVNFLKSIPGNIFTGLSGSALMFDQHWEKLPKGRAYCSFDEKDRLPALEYFHRVPCFDCHADGYFHFFRLGFGGSWDSDCLLLSFRDLSAEATVEAEKSSDA